MDELKLGRRVKLGLASGVSIEGVVFAKDGQKVVLETFAGDVAPSIRDTRVINLTAIKTLSVVQDNVPMDALPPISREMAMQREKLASQKHEEALFRRGPAGTSKEAQDIFDTLSRTFACSWKDKSIYESKLNVTINPPYAPENVVGADAKAVKHMRDLLAKIKIT